MNMNSLCNCKRKMINAVFSEFVHFRNEFPKPTAILLCNSPWGGLTFERSCSQAPVIIVARKLSFFKNTQYIAMFLGIYAMFLYRFYAFLFLSSSLLIDTYHVFLKRKEFASPILSSFLRFYCIIYLYEINKITSSFFRDIRTFSFIACYIVRENLDFPASFIVWYK